MASLHDELLHAARVRMIRNIDTTDRLIRQLYIRAAKRIEAQIGAAKPGGLTERWLVSYKAGLEKEIDRLGRGLYDAVYDAAREAAEDRVEAELAYMDAAAARAGTGLSQRFVDTLSAVPTDTLRAMFEGKLYTDGRMLSQRIWAEEGRLQGNIAEIIQQGIAQQTDPLTLARHLEAYVNPKAACPVSWHTLYPSIPFDRKIDYNALRLARTSIIHAHWIAGKAAAKKNPLCAGMKWNLSNQHYERQVAVAGEDVCDEYARHDEGLGRGVFPVDGLPLPHPNCLCYQTEVVPTLEDAVDRLLAWDGTNDPALNDAFEKWRKENAAELDQLHEKWNRELGGVDKDGKSDTIKLEDGIVPRSLGARAMNYDILSPEGDRYYHYAEGTKIQNREVFAGYKTRTPLDDGVPEGLTKEFGGDPEKWQHVKGEGIIDDDGEHVAAEVHWFYQESIGQVKHMIKRWLE